MEYRSEPIANHSNDVIEFPRHMGNSPSAGETLSPRPNSLEADVIDHPLAELMRQIQAEDAAGDAPDGKVLMEELCRAADAYANYLESRGIFCSDDGKTFYASGLLIDVVPCVGIDILITDGGRHRLYGDGKDPNSL
jgi:hypothetical protein